MSSCGYKSVRRSAKLLSGRHEFESRRRLKKEILLKKLQLTCDDQFFAWFSSAGQIKVVSLQVVIKKIYLKCFSKYFTFLSSHLCLKVYWCWDKILLWSLSVWSESLPFLAWIKTATTTGTCGVFLWRLT